MPDKTWVSIDGNWQTAASWNPSGVPIAADSIHFTGASIVDVTTGPASALAYTEINVHEDYPGTIMSSGSKLAVANLTTLRFNSRGGRLYLQVVTGATLTDVFYETAKGVSDALELDAAGTGIISNLNIDGATGGVTVTANANSLVNVEQHGSPNAILTIGAGVGGLARIRQTSGLIINNAVITAGAGAGQGSDGRVIVAGGTFRQQYTGATSPDIDQLWIFGHDRPAIFEDRVSGTDNVAITQVYATGPGAMFDGRLCKRTTRTITNSEGRDRARVLFRNALDSYVLTNDFRDYGARFQHERGGGVGPS